MVLRFNFHGIVAFEVETEDADASAFFRAEYGTYLTERLAPNTPLVTLQFARGGMRFVPSGWVRHTHKVLARWAYRVGLGDNTVKIAAIGNRWAIPMVHHMLVHSSLRYLAAGNGALMLHAGAVERAGRSLLLTGYGGAGKTTTVSMLLASGNGIALQSDDYVFVSPSGETFSYLTRSHLYQPLLAWVPELRERLTASERLRLRILGAIRHWSKDAIKWPVRMEQERLWPGVPHARRARLAAMVWLERSDGARASLERFTPGPEDVEALLKMNFYEARHFLTLLRAQVAGWEPQVERWRAREAKLLRKLVGAVPSYRLALPRGGKDASFLPALLELLDE